MNFEMIKHAIEKSLGVELELAGQSSGVRKTWNIEKTGSITDYGSYAILHSVVESGNDISVVSSMLNYVEPSAGEQMMLRVGNGSNKNKIKISDEFEIQLTRNTYGFFYRHSVKENSSEFRKKVAAFRDTVKTKVASPGMVLPPYQNVIRETYGDVKLKPRAYREFITSLGSELHGNSMKIIEALLTIILDTPETKPVASRVVAEPASDVEPVVDVVLVAEEAVSEPTVTETSSEIVPTVTPKLTKPNFSKQKKKAIKDDTTDE